MFTPSLDLHIYTYFNNIACCFFYRKLKKDSLKFEYSMGVSPCDSFETFSVLSSFSHGFSQPLIQDFNRTLLDHEYPPKLHPNPFKTNVYENQLMLEWFPKKDMAIWVFP